FDFVNKVNQTVDRAHKAIKNIRSINGKLKEFIEQNKTDSTATTLVKQAEKIQKSLTQIEETLYQTQNRSNQDPLNFPIRLTNKLGHLNRLITMDDFPPTAQEEAVRKELTTTVDQTMEAYKKIIDQDVIEFNKVFKNEKRDFLSIK
ncbi:MAG: glycosyl hydrolase, partial [Flavobacteriaceae bacterium]